MRVQPSVAAAKERSIEQFTDLEAVVLPTIKVTKCDACGGKGRMKVRMYERTSWQRVVCIVCRGRGFAVV